MGLEQKKKFIIEILFIVTIAAVVYFVFKYLIIWLAPFLVGLLIVLIMQPVSRLLQKAIPGRNRAATFFSLLILYLLIGVLIWIGASAFIGKCSEWLVQLPDVYEENIAPMLTNLNDWTIKVTQRFAPDLEAYVSEMAKNFTSALATAIGDWSTSLLNALTEIVRHLPMYLVTLVFTIMCSFFISLNYPTVKTFLLRQFPDRGANLLDFFQIFFREKLFKVVKAYFLIMCITFAENAIGLSIIGAENPILVAAIIALCDILPIVGSGTILLPWALVKLITGNFFMALGLVILYVIIAVVRNAIEPKIVGTQIGLNPIVTLTAMYAGLRIFGFVGFFIGPLLVLTLVNLHDAGYIHIWQDVETETPTPQKEEGNDL